MKKINQPFILLTILLSSIFFPFRALPSSSCGHGGATGDVHEQFEGSEYYLYVPSDASMNKSYPLFVALHGDEGDPQEAIIWYWSTIWEDRKDFILLAPRAPYANGSWWQDNEGHDQWLTQLIDTILSQYNIDLERIHLYGHSGGATFLGYFALIHQDRYASVGYCIGGFFYDYQPYQCKIPARMVDGTDDFLYDHVTDLVNELESREHEVDFVEIPNWGHDVHEECLEPMLEWLFEHPLCGSNSDDSCGADGDADGDGDGDSDTDVDSDIDSDTDSDYDVSSDVSEDLDENLEHMDSGCSCRML